MQGLYRWLIAGGDAVSAEADVRERFGPPHMAWRNEDGSVTWEFSRQPQGVECFMITVGTDDILRSIDQVLNEQTFARVENGMNGDQFSGFTWNTATAMKTTMVSSLMKTITALSFALSLTPDEVAALRLFG